MEKQKKTRKVRVKAEADAQDLSVATVLRLAAEEGSGEDNIK